MARNTGLRPGQKPGPPFQAAKMRGGAFDEMNPPNPLRRIIRRLLNRKR